MIKLRHGNLGRVSSHLASALILCASSSITLAQVSPGTSPAAAQPLPPAAPLAGPSDAPSLSVPRMLDRPLGLEEGPRVRVKGFKLTGAIDHPKHGITVSGLNQELNQAVQAQSPEGYTILQLQQVATRLSDRYHKSGMILAQVVVPAQEVRDGIVELRVLEGVLESVKVEGNKHNRATALKAPFKPLVGKAFEQAPTDAALLRLTEYPGLSVFGVITPGTAVGTSDLVLRVQHERALEAGLSVDNFGTALTGEDRANLSLRWNSPLGLGDRLSLYGVHGQTSGDSAARTNYGSADYRLPMFAARGALSLGYSLNNYDVGARLGVTGKVKATTVAYHQEFFRSRRAVFYGELAAADKRADVTYPAALGSPPGQEKVKDYSLLLGWRYSDRAHGFNDFSVSLLRGDLSAPEGGGVPVRPGAASSYSLVSFRLQRQQALTRYQSLVLTAGGQLTHDALASLDESALGGPSNARGYGVAAYVGDQTTFGSLEWVMGAPGFAAKPGFRGKTWGELLQFSLFADAAHGKSNLQAGFASAQLPPVSMKDWGAALQFVVPERFFARVSWAKKISPDPFFQFSDPKTGHFYGSLGFTY